MGETWKPGQIIWQDLTVPDAETVRDFYSAVVGWEFRGEDMGDYEDYSMLAPDSEKPVAGVCHARDTNANVPPQWLVYIAVDDFDARVAAVEANGGRIVDGPRMMGKMPFAAVQDPAGAVFALMGPSS